MRKSLYILAHCTFLLFFAFLVNGCSLHEEPELTPDGELGVDPTAVTLNLNLIMNLSLAERRSAVRRKPNICDVLSLRLIWIGR